MNVAEELAAAEVLNQLRAPQKAASQGPETERAPAPPPLGGSAADVATASYPSAPAPQLPYALDPPIRRSASEGPNAGSPLGAQKLEAAVPASAGGEAREPPRENADSGSGSAPAPQAEPAKRPWRNVLLTATSMMLTKDARRKLRQLLAVLRLASEHLNSRVSALKTAMDEDASNDNVKPKISKQAIRRDIITTIKKCLAMLSTMATNSLPAVARQRMRSTILKLPARWASQMDAVVESKDSETESAVLALATETLVSIRNITLIISETLDRADNWVEKLPQFKRGKRQRDDLDQLPDQPQALPAIAAGALTRSSSASTLQGGIPITRPSSPEEAVHVPSPKAIKVEATLDEKALATASTVEDISAPTGPVEVSP